MVAVHILWGKQHPPKNCVWVYFTMWSLGKLYFEQSQKANARTSLAKPQCQVRGCLLGGQSLASQAHRDRAPNIDLAEQSGEAAALTQVPSVAPAPHSSLKGHSATYAMDGL